MEWMIWPGAFVAFLGLLGLIYCIISAARARAQGLEPEQMQARLQKLVAINMAALGVSAIGLMMVVVGILLG
ncbi:MAG TPA: hypothetical protein ENJ26_03755 [Rhodobacteraceae bacterium]|nr:hypothetical protein [Paracoccaceae bacterium]